MSRTPIGSTAPPKRRKKNQSKTRRSRVNGRNNGDAVEEISIPAEETIHEGWRNLVTYGSTDHPNSKSVTTATPIPIRSVAPIDDTQPLSKELTPPSPNVEATNTSEKFFSMDGCGSPAIDISDECFTPKTPENMIQPHILSAPQTDLDINFIWNPFQNERLRTVKSEEEAMGTITAMNFDLGTSAPFPHIDLNFGHSSIASSPDTTFDFNLDVETDSALPMAKFPFGNWTVPNFPSVFTSPIATDQLYTDSSQPQQTTFCTDFGQDTIISSNENDSDEIAILFAPDFYDLFQEQEPLAQKDAKKPLIDSYSDPAEYDTRLSEILPSEQAACSGKGPRKRSSSGDDGCDGGEDANLTNCGRLPRDNGGVMLLACPFHKRNPQRYQECGKYILRRIKDVKQHIYRLHCKPEHYCSRCFKSFKCSNERDHHIREGGCTLQAVPNHDGVISDNQRKELKECKSRGTSKQKQWMELWDVIFPGVKPPRSPYIESGQAELLSSLRTYWDGNADKIIARSIGNYDLELLGSSGIREVVDVILDHFETDRANWDLTTDREGGGAPQPPLASPNSVEDILSHLFLLD
ncbi:hypothetical protein F4782DRAFT_512970 [Xylaria castorea]|nr:hypothetical protein F4782DRAFT_512970 [Xylaria castorea]